MNDKETLIKALQTLYARLEALRNLEGQEMLLPGSIERYHRTLEDAYAAFGEIETVVDELGQELGYQHTRLDNEVEKYSSQLETEA